MSFSFNLAGETALITGANGGFGSRFAEVLSENRAKVGLVGRNGEQLEVLGQSLNPDWGWAKVVVDLRRGSPTPTQVFDEIEKTLGPVSILVNNAGIGHFDRSETLPPHVWHEVLAVDLDTPFEYAQEAARRIIARKGSGSIINVASIFGQMGSKGMLAYATAKAGLIQMTRALAVEWGPRGVRVNALAPGWCYTKMTHEYLASARGQATIREIPLGRAGEPADLDGALLLLASRAGRYINGATIVVDGGLSVAMRG